MKCFYSSVFLLLSFTFVFGEQKQAYAQDADSKESESFIPLPNLGVLKREERHRWERHVRGFRREHNFATMFGVSSGTWKVKKFDELENENFENSGLYSKFQYTFHLPIWKGFGYMLGSSAGYHHETADGREKFAPVGAVMFPGIVVGLVYNFSPVFRVSTTFDTYLERHDGIRERLPNSDNPESQEFDESVVDDDQEISVTMVAYDVAGHLDLFYDLSWGIRLEFHRREIEFQAPEGAENVGAINARFRKIDRWIGLGLIYHLL